MEYTNFDKLPCCEDCKALAGGGRYVPAYKNLLQIKFIKVPSAMAADEWHYKCSACGHEWLYETRVDTAGLNEIKICRMVLRKLRMTQ
jgi:predicted SprT family Zn-dependent metalloprotease